MGLPRNITTFLTSLPLRDMRGEDVFVAISFFLVSGSDETEVSVKDVEKSWSKGVIGKKYNPAYYSRAKGRIHPTRTSAFTVTEDGISYVQALIGEIPTHATTLMVFKAGNAYSFDKFIREVLRESGVAVDIADTYVAGSIFDTLLHVIPMTTPIRIVYKSDTGGFASTAGKFGKQYSLMIRRSEQFHDRFLIIDGKGYIVGPSLNHAADKKPATVVALNVADSKKLIDLFEWIWGSTT